MHDRSISSVHIPPVVMLDEHCAWCWQAIHPTLPYPETWSSTICSAHADLMIERHARLRLLRPAAKEARAS
jgi:hypothetical protein